jgi:5-formyltetrahydrofolate cyclo-ligase
VNGEFPTQAIIQGLQSIHKNIYLPIVHKKSQSLSFQHYQSQTPMRRNTFGIAEPIPNAKKQILSPQLDLVIMPLTGFDFKGNRIGMGGGYYDRSFEFLLKHSNTPKPFMLGLGYQVQKSNNIIPQHWDVPLNGILTEATLIRIK